MRTLIELKRDREFLDSVIKHLQNKSVLDLFFEIFSFFENECFLNDDKLPDELKHIAKEFWDLSDEDEIPTEEWLRSNLEIVPYLEDVVIGEDLEYWWGDPGLDEEEMKSLMAPFIMFKGLDIKSFLEKLYYEDSIVFILISDSMNIPMKRFKGSESFMPGEIMTYKESASLSRTISISRTYNFVYTIDNGSGQFGCWFEKRAYEIDSDKEHDEFNFFIQPESIYEDNIYREDPVSSEQIMRWLYGEA